MRSAPDVPRWDEWIRLGVFARLDRGERILTRSGTTDGYGIPPGRVKAGADCRESPPLTPTRGLLADLGPLPDEVTVPSLIRRARTTRRPCTTPSRTALINVVIRAGVHRWSARP